MTGLLLLNSEVTELSTLIMNGGGGGGGGGNGMHIDGIGLGGMIIGF